MTGALLWGSLPKMVGQGFGVVHQERPPPSAVPNIFFHQFVTYQEKWDSPRWVEEPRPCDDSIACSINAACRCSATWAATRWTGLHSRQPCLCVSLAWLGIQEGLPALCSTTTT